MTESTKVQTGMAAIPGASLYYEMAGQGPALVLAHAGVADRRMWDDQFPVFARHFRVVRYDARGYGNSPLTPGPFSHYQDLYELLRFLGIERAHLIGCSMGGGTCVDLAVTHPERVSSLIPVCSALSGYQFHGEMPALFLQLVTALKEERFDEAAELAVRIWVDGPERGPDQVDPHVQDRVREMSVKVLVNEAVQQQPPEPPAIERLGSLAVPTLVIAGELDDPSVKEMAGLLAAGIPGARKLMIRAAHFPNMEKPAEFNQAVLTFLQAS